MARKATTKEGRKPKKQTEVTSDLETEKKPTLSPPTDDTLEKFRRSQEKTTSWLWLGVIGFSIIIFFFWGWSMVNNLSLFSWKRTGENTLIKKTQNDWNEIFTETIQKESDKKQLKEKINNVLEELKKQSLTSPTSTTSTTTASSTSTTTSTIR